MIIISGNLILNLTNTSMTSGVIVPLSASGKESRTVTCIGVSSNTRSYSRRSILSGSGGQSFEWSDSGSGSRSWSIASKGSL